MNALHRILPDERLTKVNTELFSESRRNNTVGLQIKQIVRDMPEAWQVVRRMAEAIESKSEHAQIRRVREEWAEFEFDRGDSTLREIVRGHTKAVDMRIVTHLAAVCVSLGIDPVEVSGLEPFMRLMSMVSQERARIAGLNSAAIVEVKE